MPCISCGETKSRMYLGRDDICGLCYRTKKYFCQSCGIDQPFSQYWITKQIRRTICLKCEEKINHEKRRNSISKTSNSAKRLKFDKPLLAQELKDPATILFNMNSNSNSDGIFVDIEDDIQITTTTVPTVIASPMEVVPASAPAISGTETIHKLGSGTLEETVANLAKSLVPAPSPTAIRSKPPSGVVRISVGSSSPQNPKVQQQQIQPTQQQPQVQQLSTIHSVFKQRVEDLKLISTQLNREMIEKHRVETETFKAKYSFPVSAKERDEIQKKINEMRNRHIFEMKLLQVKILQDFTLIEENMNHKKVQQIPTTVPQQAAIPQQAASQTSVQQQTPDNIINTAFNQGTENSIQFDDWIQQKIMEKTRMYVDQQVQSQIQKQNQEKDQHEENLRQLKLQEVQEKKSEDFCVESFIDLMKNNSNIRDDEKPFLMEFATKLKKRERVSKDFNSNLSNLRDRILNEIKSDSTNIEANCLIYIDEFKQALLASIKM